MKRRLSIVACLLLGVTGCVRYGQPPGGLRPPELLRAYDHARALAAPQVGAEGSLRVAAPGRSAALRLVVLSALPRRLRVELRSRDDRLVALWASDGKRLVGYERGGDACWVGPACPEAFERVLGVAVDVPVVAMLLRGGFPPWPPAAPTRWDAAAGLEVVVYESPTETRYEVGYDPCTARVRRIVAVDAQGRRWTAWLEGYAPDVSLRVGVPAPGRVVLDPAGPGEARWTLEVFDAAMPLDEGAFAVQCPRGMAVHHLQCDGGD